LLGLDRPTEGKFDEAWWLQKFTPRGSRSMCWKINREKAIALIAARKMMPSGLTEDLELALARNPRAKKFFVALDSRNRYAILFRCSTPRKPRRAPVASPVRGDAREGEKLHS
jgi:uncharacterized protein YdeI (YjbR/CyaY-like superfamily)